MPWLYSDIRYSLRLLLRNPAFTIVAAVALSLGIGANTAIYSVADAFLFKPLPFRDLHRLAAVMEIHSGLNDDWGGAAPANYLDWKQQTHSFERMAGYNWSEVNLTGEGEPEKLTAALVTRDFFPLLGIEPMKGRYFLPEEDQPGSNQVVVLSRGLWERRFGSDPEAVGRTIKLDGRSCTVVGIMPKQFLFPMASELWMPLALNPNEQTNRTSRYVHVFGRLSPGASLTQARAEMQTIAQRLSAAYPDANRGWAIKVAPLHETVVGDLTRQYTLLLLGAVGFVLLIACANVANLQFVRASARVREVALRAALGGSRWRIIRQLLTESILVALFGAAGGLLLGIWGMRLITTNMPPDVAKWIAGWNEIRLDLRVLAWTLTAGVFAGVISGLAPALSSSRPDLNEALKETGRAMVGRSRQRIRNSLVILEIALALILVVGAGLTIKGLRALIDLNQGFEPATVLTMQLNLPRSRYAVAHQRVAFYDQVLTNLESLPGVRAASVVTAVPFSGAGWQMRTVTIEGRQADDLSEANTVQVQTISSNYFRTMHIPRRDGRELSDRDGMDSPRAAVVSEALVRRYYPGASPIGRRLKLGSSGSSEPWLTIVGVVADVKQHWITRDPVPMVYVPYRQAPLSFSSIVLRTDHDPIQFVPGVKAQIAAVDPSQPIYEVKPLDRVIAESTIGLAYVAVSMAVLGAIALILSSVGIYAVMAFTVTERTHEIGVRMALGAGQSDIMRMVLGRGALLTGLGLGTGLPAALLLAHVLTSLLFGVSASDAPTFGALSVMLAAIALLACYIPGRRAARISPIRALRTE